MMSSQNPFDEIEAELRKSLTRKEPPQGFDLRVAARLRKKGSRGWLRIPRLMRLPQPAMRLVTAALLLVAICGGVIGYQHYERRQQEGEAAKRELLLALRITGSKVRYAQERVNRLGSQHYGSADSDSEKSQ